MKKREEKGSEAREALALWKPAVMADLWNEATWKLTAVVAEMRLS